MQLRQQYQLAEKLERYLGDPEDPAAPVSFGAALEMDEREEYPIRQTAFLDNWNLCELYVPAHCGGRLGSFEEVFAILRVLSRRDLTLALSHVVTFLGALPVWIAGSDEQKRHMAELVRAGHKVAFALSERMRGSDLLANEVEARQDGDSYVISGEKWMVGNATRSTALSLFARTRPEGGPRGFSLLFVDKRSLDPARFRHLPKVPTVGLRGSDLSGICFQQCRVQRDSCIGPAGSGFELTLRTLQVTRTFCTGLSLGAADTALRLAADFAIKRRLYGANVYDIPHARAVLANAFIDLMICDCVAISALRALQARPGQASLWSAVAKYFVPTRIESVIRDIAVVLGARFFLRSEHAWSMFQKMARDSAIVSVFEGSTVVQLDALALQLGFLPDRGKTVDDTFNDRLRTVFSLDAPIPAFDPAQLDLFSREGDDAVSGIPFLCDHLRAAGASEETMNAARRVLDQSAHLTGDLERSRRLQPRSIAAFDLAKRYARLHVSACCIGFWIYNRETLDEFLGREKWLVNCLNRLFAEGELIEDARTEAELLDRVRAGRLLSAVPFSLSCGERNTYA